MKKEEQIFQNVIAPFNLSRLATEVVELVELLKQYEAEYGPVSKRGRKPKNAMDFKDYVDKHRKRT